MDTNSAIYNKLQKELSTLEAQRLEILKYNRIITFSLPIGIFVIFGFTLLPTVERVFNIPFLSLISVHPFILVFPLIILVIHCLYKSSRLTTELKKNIFPVILSSINPSFKYLGTQGISKPELSNAGFTELGSADRLTMEDVMCGVWNNHNFKFGEILVQNEHRDSDGDTSYSTLFKGQFIKLDYNKKFHGTTVIRSSKGNPVRVFNKLPKITLEDVEFNKIFKVESTDEVECRYLLTPSFMEKIKKLKNNYTCKTLNISFAENCIYLLINQKKNLFEIDLKTSFYNDKFLDSILSDFSLINDLCESLDLDREKRWVE